jgi:drug/metabolite transporter (DMT)-like permease
MTSRAAKSPAAPWLVWLALLTVYVVWGSTYLAIRVVVDSMPPLLAAGARFLPAALLVMGWLALRRGPVALRITRREALTTAFVGACLLFGGNGMVSIAERDVPSGLTAVLVATLPLMLVIMRRALGERPRRLAVFGVLFGLVGVAVLVLPQGFSGAAPFGGMALLLVSVTSWSIGSLASPRIGLPADTYLSTSYQMLFGALLLGAVGLLLGEGASVDIAAYPPESFLALGYLIVFGSIVAYPAYGFLLQNAPISRVSTYAYVNPVVAVALGALLLHERLDLGMLLGASIIIVAVAIIVTSDSRSKREGAASVADVEPERPPAPVGSGQPARGAGEAG